MCSLYSVMASSRSWTVQTLQSVISEIDSIGRYGSISIQRAESIEWRVELVYRDLVVKDVYGVLEQEETECLQLVAQAYSHLQQLIESLQCVQPQEQQPLLILDGSVGRPHYNIPYHQLERLICMHFSVPQIAQLIGVSVSTIRRRMNDYQLTIRDTYSNISDSELDYLVGEIQQQFAGWGYRQVYGMLVSLGIRVPFLRVQESQRRVDPEGSIIRRLQQVQRRRYSVPGPRHLWHMDGNHKLIRYAAT